MTEAIISPADSFEDTTITCTPQGGTDADGDPVEFSYLWFVDRIVLGSLLIPSQERILTRTSCILSDHTI